MSSQLVRLSFSLIILTTIVNHRRVSGESTLQSRAIRGLYMVDLKTELFRIAGKAIHNHL